MLIKCDDCNKTIEKNQPFVVIPEGIISSKEVCIHYSCAVEILCPKHNMLYPCSFECVALRKKEQLLAAE